MPVGWKLTTSTPTVAIAQLRTKYRVRSATDARIHVDVTTEYRQLLFSVLDFARVQDVQFCIFPEYAWSQDLITDGLATIEKHAEMRAYVLPVEHLTLDEYRHLLKTLSHHRWLPKDLLRDELKELDEAVGGNWITNVALIALSTPARLTVIPQRKLYPAALEELSSSKWKLFRGRQPRIIAGENCRFSVLICFDLISRDDAKVLRPRDLLTNLDDPIDYVFVPECNPKPLHDLYLKAAIAMFQSPMWGRRAGTVIIANAAEGSRLALLEEPLFFGYSRLLGNLGRITPSSTVHHVFDGYVMNPAPRGFSEMTNGSVCVGDRQISTVVTRPEQSVVVVRLPPVRAGVRGDLSGGRFDTSVDVFRPGLLQAKAWPRVRPVPLLELPPDEFDVPYDHIIRHDDGLEGVGELVGQLEEVIHTRTTPVFVRGGGGTGKSALVATVLSRIAAKDRIVWIDLAQVEPVDDALLELVLLKLRANRSLEVPVEDREKTIRDLVRERPTVIVLDSIEAWGDHPIPDSILKLHGWKTVVIVIGRPSRKGESPITDIELKELKPADFERLLERNAERTAPPDYVSTLFDVTLGMPLAAVWGGQLMRQSPEEARELAAALRARNAKDLQALYDWCYQSLREPTPRDILGILCELPVAVPTSDLAAVLKKPEAELRDAVDRLTELGLIVHTRGHDMEQLHFRHAFVHQFWTASSTPTDRKAASDNAVTWARLIARRFGGDRNFNGFAELGPRWANISHILRKLSKRAGDNAKSAFLAIWRDVDDFLWVSGRWRERITFGEIAVRLAEEAARLDLQVYALYDALAKTRWHVDRQPDEALQLLDRAFTSAAQAKKRRRTQAQIEWYRSRAFRHFRNFDAALEAANRALDLATMGGNNHDLALTYNAVGNVFREMKDMDAARSAYEQALDTSKESREQWAREIVAIVTRNLGRLASAEGRWEEAVLEYERAQDLFEELGSEVKKAECIIDHAFALARLGEGADAELELLWAQSIISSLGSMMLDRRIADTRKAIRNAK